MKKWKTLATETVLDNKWCVIHKDTVELPLGKIIDDYFLNIRPDVVLVLPVTTGGKVVMVRQYKHGAKQILLEFPGGVMDADEQSPQIAAERELREETGYSSSSIETLGVVYDNPTKDTNRIYFFIAHNAEKRHDTEFDATEDIETVEIPVHEIPHLIKTQQINVAGSVAIYYMALALMGEELS